MKTIFKILRALVSTILVVAVIGAVVLFGFGIDPLENAGQMSVAEIIDRLIVGERTDIVAEISEIGEEYAANAIAAKEKYKKARFKTGGMITDIYEENNRYVLKVTDSLAVSAKSVKCVIKRTEDNKDYINKIKIGDIVLLTGISKEAPEEELKYYLKSCNIVKYMEKSPENYAEFFGVEGIVDGAVEDTTNAGKSVLNKIADFFKS